MDFYILRLVFVLQICLFFSLLTLAAGVGVPCSKECEVVIPVRSWADIQSRLQYHPTKTVHLVLLNDIILEHSSLLLNASFSCTIISSLGHQRGVNRRIAASQATFPAIRISGASNILIHNVGFSVPGDAAITCPATSLQDLAPEWLCPAVYIRSSSSVQLVAAPIRGRVDVIRSSQISLDSLSVSSVHDDKALVQVMFCGDGPNLVKSDISVTNSNLTGSQIGVLVYRGSVGVTVSNNHILNPVFAGIQCGQGVHNVGDCMLCSFLGNFITFTPDFTPLEDSAAIYLSTHWVNPGNYMSCNYAVGGRQCLYLDYCSSGLTVEGHVCWKTVTGLKLNTGHANNISSFLSVAQSSPGWISCQNYYVNNCNQELGKYWDQTRLKSYNSPAFQQNWPWLNDFCTREKSMGHKCNPLRSVSASITGRCSGLPTDNVVDMAIVDAVDGGHIVKPTYLNCKGISSVAKLNTLGWRTYSSSSVKFLNLAQGDLGIQEGSPLLALHTNFKSCPKSAVGPQSVRFSTYVRRFHQQEVLT